MIRLLRSATLAEITEILQNRLQLAFSPHDFEENDHSEGGRDCEHLDKEQGRNYSEVAKLSTSKTKKESVTKRKYRSHGLFSLSLGSGLLRLRRKAF